MRISLNFNTLRTLAFQGPCGRTDPIETAIIQVRKYTRCAVLEAIANTDFYFHLQNKSYSGRHPAVSTALITSVVPLRTKRQNQWIFKKLFSRCPLRIAELSMGTSISELQRLLSKRM